MTPLFALIIGLLPSFIWLLFYLHEDEEHPEPRRTLLLAFLAGIGSTFFVIGPQIALNDILPDFGIKIYSFGALFLLAAIEEIFKFLAVYFVIARRPEFDEPIDAMMYMVVASLGFAAVENIASVMQSSAQLTSGTLGLEVASLRFVGATLLHTLSSALVGYYWGMALAEKKPLLLPILEGLGVATILHTVFNSFIVMYGPTTPVATLFLITASFFVLNDFELLKHDNSTQNLNV